VEEGDNVRNNFHFDVHFKLGNIDRFRMGNLIFKSLDGTYRGKLVKLFL